MTIEEFTTELRIDLSAFYQNMKNQNAQPQTFPEWYNMFGRWLEVGTEMEDEYWSEE